ncbi:MAG: vWA domain-containing protein [Sarcina sp.]
MVDKFLSEEDFFNEDNPTTRVPVCLVLDTSGSMNGNPIQELNKGVELFFKTVADDEIAKFAAEISIITFGIGGVTQIVNFAEVENQKVPRLRAGSVTPMGEAVNKAIDVLMKRKEIYSDNGVSYFQPWLVLMTDGKATDNISEASKRATDLVNERKLTVIPVGIGNAANLAELALFSPKIKPAKLKGLEFDKFFSWLSQSVISTSMSTPADPINLSNTNSWNTIAGACEYRG